MALARGPWAACRDGMAGSLSSLCSSWRLRSFFEGDGDEQVSDRMRAGRKRRTKTIDERVFVVGRVAQSWWQEERFRRVTLSSCEGCGKDRTRLRAPRTVLHHLMASARTEDFRRHALAASRRVRGALAEGGITHVAQTMVDDGRRRSFFKGDGDEQVRDRAGVSLAKPSLLHSDDITTFWPVLTHPLT